MDAERIYDEGERTALLDTLFGQAQPIVVVAAFPSGLFAPMPAAVPVDPERIIRSGSTFIELVLPTEVPLVIDTWERVLSAGIARATVHLLTDLEQPVEFSFVDARYRYGVLLAFIIGSKTGKRAVPVTWQPRVRFATMRKDGRAKIESIDASVTQMLGWSSEEMVGHRSLEFVHPDDQALTIGHWIESLRHPNSERRLRFRHRCKDGSWMWVEVANRNALDDPARACVASEMFDISDEMAALEALRAREQLLLLLTEAVPLGILQVDAARNVVHRNQRLCAMLGNDAATLAEQFASVEAEDQPALQASVDALFRDGSEGELELTLRSDGVPKRCSFNMRALTHDDGSVSGAIVCISDITERTRLNEKLEFRATFDALTSCQNRASILTALEAALLGDLRAGNGVAILFLDLDRFKSINDRLGHGAGDAVLQRTGERLIALLRGNDAVGRLGGDEFLVIARDVRSAKRAMDLAGRISQSVRESVTFGGRLIAIGCSIGVAWTDSPIDSAAFVAAADAAMYRSKRECGGAPVLAGAETEFLPQRQLSESTQPVI